MLDVELELRDQIKDLVRSKKFEELDEVWLSDVVAHKHTPAFHESMGLYFVRKKQPERLEDLYTVLLSQRIEDGEYQHALEVIEAILKLDPAFEFLRPLIVDTLKGLYADYEDSQLNEFLRISGVSGDAPNLKAALERFLDLVGASVGQVFLHSQWGIGIVRELDARTGAAWLDFPKKRGHRMTIEGIKNFLRRIPDDDIRSRIARNRDQLREEIFADPCMAVRMALKSAGGKLKAGDLKKLLTQDFLSESEYRKWWNKAKDEARLDPFIDQAGVGTGMTLKLRKDPRSFADEVVTRLHEARDAETRRRVLRDVSKHGSNADFKDSDVQALAEAFLKPLENGELRRDSDRLAHGLLFLEYADLFPDGMENPVNVDALIRETGDLNDLVLSIPNLDLQRLSLERVLDDAPERAPELLAEIMLEAEPRLATWIDRTLVDLGQQDVRDHCLERIYARADNPVLFAWLVRNALMGNYPTFSESFPPIMILIKLLSVLSEVADEMDRLAEDEQEALKTGAAALRNVLMDGHQKLVKSALKTANLEEARRFMAQVHLSNGISNQLREAIEHVVNTEHPDLRRTSKAEEEEERRRPSYHYTTAESVEAKRRELSQILNVEVPANSKAIGEAADLGDLRENAEYHAAKDRQKLLMQRATELEDLISRARVVDLEKVTPDVVRFGTRVTLRNHRTGRDETYTLLGLWEADAPNGIISYMTPFGSQLINRKPGESFDVTLPDGSTVGYSVTSVEKSV